MKVLISLLTYVFTAVELLAQILLSPLTLLLMAGLIGFTALMRRQLRKNSWRRQARWAPESSAGVSLAT